MAARAAGSHPAPQRIGGKPQSILQWVKGEARVRGIAWPKKRELANFNAWFKETRDSASYRVKEDGNARHKALQNFPEARALVEELLVPDLDLTNSKEHAEKEGNPRTLAEFRRRCPTAAERSADRRETERARLLDADAAAITARQDRAKAGAVEYMDRAHDADPTPPTRTP